MTRDEILAEIKRLSTTEPDTDAGYVAGQVSDAMREVSRLADAYMGEETGDVQYLAEALTDAMERFADMIHEGR